MPTGNEVEVTLCLTDGTKLTRIENLADTTTFLEQHEEYVKIVRCKDCKHHEDEEVGMVYCPNIVGGWVQENFYCGDGERDEVEK